MSMSNYDFLKPRERHRSLFIVEGKHEKYELIELLLKSFPEINIRKENIVIFETNIYILYNKIFEEYGEDWDELEVDLVKIISISVTLKKGKFYKNSLNCYFVTKMTNLSTKIDEILAQKYEIKDCDMRNNCKEQLMMLHNSTSLEQRVEEILSSVLNGKNLQSARHHLIDLIGNANFCNEDINYYEYMRKLFVDIIKHNIRKANKIQGGVYSFPDEQIRDIYFDLDFVKILKEENKLSRDAIKGIIMVLNTSIFFVTDYKFSLIE